jgi:hypothetical protein
MRSDTVLRISAVLMAVLYLGGGAVLGQLPAGGASGPEVVDWLSGHGWEIRAAVWLWTMEAIAAAAFVGIARNRLPAPHRDVFLIGGASFIAESAVSTWILAGLSWHTPQLDPHTARTLLDVAAFWGPVLNGSTIAMLAPVVVLSWGRVPVLPRWLGLIGAAALIEQTVESVLTIFGSTGFTEPGGAMNLELGAGLVIIWVICLAFGLPRGSTAAMHSGGGGADSTLSATG